MPLFRIAKLALAVMLILPSATLLLNAQTNVVTYHDLTAMARWPLGNMQVKGAMGQSGSLAVAEMPPGTRGRAGTTHYHEQEQIVLGLGGSPVIGLSGVAYRVGSFGALITPPNVEHFNMNGLLAGPSTFIEFQPVLRSDWFPPQTPYVASKTPAPAAVSRDERVFDDFDPASDGWRSDPNGARSKVLNGRTVRLTMWDLSGAKASAGLNPQGKRSEQFVYVLEGHAQIVVDSRGRDVPAQTLAVISPAAKDVRLASLGTGRTLVAVFESITP
jgi:hypothetical protein